MSVDWNDTHVVEFYGGPRHGEQETIARHITGYTRGSLGGELPCVYERIGRTNKFEFISAIIAPEIEYGGAWRALLSWYRWSWMVRR